MDRQPIFREQKGPDFVSRLRGHINVLPVNPDDTAIKDEGGLPIKPIIRRALTLRGLILWAELFVDRDGCKVASIDEDVLYALLTVDNFRHGTRSMEAILQMCTPIDGVIEKASLPSRPQLDMHVDAEEFYIRVQRGRFRRYLETSQPSDSVVPTQKKSSPKRGPGPTGEIAKSTAGGPRKHVAQSARDIAAGKKRKPPVKRRKAKGAKRGRK